MVMSCTITCDTLLLSISGDKPETAVNVAYSAQLFSPAMQLLQLQARSKSVAESLIRSYLESARRESMNNAVHMQQQELTCVTHPSMLLNRDSVERDAHRIGNPWPRQRALVVDGKTLTVILDPRSGLTGPFLELTKTCSSVLACRATPLQKVRLTFLFRDCKWVFSHSFY